MCVCLSARLLSCRPAACRHQSRQAGPSRPSAKIRPQAATPPSSFNLGHIALPVWWVGVCVCVFVCVCAWQWPIQHLFLKSDQQEKQTELFTRKRAVSYLLEGTEDICREETGEETGGRKEREKEGGICGINNKSWKFRTARWRCREDKAEQIIEACVCQEIYSVLLATKSRPKISCMGEENTAVISSK